ncbi:dephospho-CoA kinase [Alsobacter sp. R-9]
MTFVLGLTGSIGMGKSTTASLFRQAGVPVHDADATVHDLYAGAAAPLVEAAFPGTTRDGVVDRAALSARVLGQPEAMAKLEAIVHPLVAAARDAFLVRHEGAPLVVLDIPLLFETGGEGLCDAVAVVSAPAPVQRERVLSRPGMTPERFEAILARQVPDSQKRARAHLVIDSGRGVPAAARQVAEAIRILAHRRGRRRQG